MVNVVKDTRLIKILSLFILTLLLPQGSRIDICPYITLYVVTSVPLFDIVTDTYRGTLVLEICCTTQLI